MECRHVSVPTEIDMRESYPRWDLPRSHRHKARNVDSRVLSKLMYEQKQIFLLQGVVTSIGAILKASTGDTICVRINLAVTP